MSAVIYPLTLQALLKGDVDLDGTVKIQAVSSSYTYSAAHDYLNDVGSGARLGTAATLTSKTFTNGEFNAAQVTYTGLTVGNVITAFIGYLDTGVESTSRLIWYCDLASDSSPLSYTVYNTSIIVKWPYGKIFTI